MERMCDLSASPLAKAAQAHALMMGGKAEFMARESDNGSEPRIHHTKNPLRPLVNLVLERVEERVGCF